VLFSCCFSGRAGVEQERAGDGDGGVREGAAAAQEPAVALRVLPAGHAGHPGGGARAAAAGAARLCRLPQSGAARAAAHVPRVLRLHGHHLAHDGIQRHPGGHPRNAAHPQQAQVDLSWLSSARVHACFLSISVFAVHAASVLPSENWAGFIQVWCFVIDLVSSDIKRTHTTGNKNISTLLFI
jgi:hypothetical protein